MASGMLTLIQVNDVHGYPEPHPKIMWHGTEAHFSILGDYPTSAADDRGRLEKPDDPRRLLYQPP